MGLYSGGVNLFKEIDAHAQVHIANTVYRQAHGILTGIEHAVFSGAVIFEFKQVVTVIQCVNVLGFASVNELHNCTSKMNLL